MNQAFIPSSIFFWFLYRAIIILVFLMNSISYSPSLQALVRKHETSSRSSGVLSFRNNVHVPKLDQFSTSECKMQAVYSRPLLVRALRDGNNAAPQSDDLPPSPSLDLVHTFYRYLNSKDVRRLEKLLDPDCVIEDEAYYKPLEGKKIHKFFEKLTEAMGQHVVFAVDRISEGDDTSIAVLWHLEWNGEVIPFTKGCSFYTFSNSNGTRLIRRAHVFVEAPFKPGEFALEMLKIIISLFDRFPQLANTFLRKPDAIVCYLLKVYKFIVEPLLLPVIMYYTRMLTTVTNILVTVLTIINNLLKVFF